MTTCREYSLFLKWRARARFTEQPSKCWPSRGNQPHTNQTGKPVSSPWRSDRDLPLPPGWFRAWSARSLASSQHGGCSGELFRSPESRSGWVPSTCESSAAVLLTVCSFCCLLPDARKHPIVYRRNRSSTQTPTWENPRPSSSAYIRCSLISISNPTQCSSKFMLFRDSNNKIRSQSGRISGRRLKSLFILSTQRRFLVRYSTVHLQKNKLLFYGECLRLPSSRV